MTATGQETPRLQIERIARNALEEIRKERAQLANRMEQLQREEEQYVDTLRSIGVTYHFDEGSKG